MYNIHIYFILQFICHSISKDPEWPSPGNTSYKLITYLFSKQNRHLLSYVFPLVPQTGLYSLVHNVMYLGNSLQSSCNDNENIQCFFSNTNFFFYICPPITTYCLSWKIQVYLLQTYKKAYWWKITHERGGGHTSVSEKKCNYHIWAAKFWMITSWHLRGHLNVIWNFVAQKW